MVVPFASTATRSAAITAPVTGMVSTLTANDETEGIELYNSAGVWRKPWNLPWGVLGRVVNGSSTQNVSTSYTDLTSLSITFPQVTNRVLGISYTMYITNTAGGANDITLRLTDTTPTTIQQYGAVRLESTGTFTVLSGYTTRLATATASTTWKLRALASFANVRFEYATSGAYFTIVDLGPGGAPS